MNSHKTSLTLIALVIALGLITAVTVTAAVVVPTAQANNGNHYRQAKNGNNGHHNCTRC